MALNRIAAALLGVGIVVAPALAQITPVPPPAAPAAPAPANTTATGRVYVSYPPQTHADPSLLAVDDAWLSDTVGAGACLYFDLPPGSHSLRTTAPTKLEIALAAGDVKYVELQVRHVYVDGRPLDTIYVRPVPSIADTSTCKATSAPAL
ncbi:MAG TPA: hypothetical protein VNU97_19420 [Rhizomicrobium sp.]|jgi:hypothetical protein|nr:hypothetical protein [Rhizomicrobium sp.]